MNIPQNQEIILRDDGINWVWYAHVIVSNGKATVTKEYRLHKFDEYQGAGKHPETIGNYRIKENSLDDSRIQGRIALGIYISNEYFPFVNPVKRWDVGKEFQK